MRSRASTPESAVLVPRISPARSSMSASAPLIAPPGTIVSPMKMLPPIAWVATRNGRSKVASKSMPAARRLARGGRDHRLGARELDSGLSAQWRPNPIERWPPKNGTSASALASSASTRAPSAASPWNRMLARRTSLRSRTARRVRPPAASRRRPRRARRRSGCGYATRSLVVRWRHSDPPPRKIGEQQATARRRPSVRVPVARIVSLALTRPNRSRAVRPPSTAGARLPPAP